MKTLTQSIKTLLLIVLSVGTASLMIACDDGKSSSRRNRLDPRVYDPYSIGQNGLRQRNCAGCPYTNNLMDGVGVVQDGIIDMEIGLSIFSDVNTGYYNQGPYTGGYSGMVQAQGTMIVNYDNSIACPVPPGQYVINTINPGMMDAFEWTNGLVLIAENYQYGVNVVMEFSGSITDLRDSFGQPVGSYVGLDGYPYNEGLQGFVTMQVEGPGFSCFNGGGGVPIYVVPPSVVY